MRQTVARLAALSTVLMLVMSVAALADEEQAPSIFIQQLRYDFGTVFEQDKYEHEFVVKNRGKADLVIDKVKPG